MYICCVQTSCITYRGLQTLTVIERCNSYGKQCDQLATQFFNNLSLVLIGLGKDAEALPLLIEAIERDPGMYTVLLCVKLHSFQLFALAIGVG